MGDSFNQWWSARGPRSNFAMNPTPGSRCSAVTGYRGRSTDSDSRMAEPTSYTRDAGGHGRLITFKVETEREDDGRWLAEVIELPGVLAYGESHEVAVSRVQALALRVIAERLEHGEAGPELLSISFKAA